MQNHKKKAAIYDRWLYTLGGGEQVAFAYAEVLRDLGYETFLLTHREIDREKAEKKMGVNLQGIELRYLPLTASIELSGETEKYDVFINTSYMDYFPNRSKKGILSVFFPAKIHLNLWDYIKISLLLPSLKKLFVYPLDFSGFRYDERKNGRVFKWLGKTSAVVFNRPIKQLQLDFFFPDFSFSAAEQITFMVNGKELKPARKTLFHSKNTLRYEFFFPRALQQYFQILLPDSERVPEIALTRLTVPGISYGLYNLFKRAFPRLEMRLHGGPEFTKRSDLQSYDHVIGISQFVQHWIRRYWRLESTVLYPPVQVQNFRPAREKKNWIIHIGRFFVTGHNKKQLEMAKVFTKMVDQGVKNWELHFIGSVHQGEKHEEYWQRVQAVAKGYPIHFHRDIGFEELQEILGQGKIYWHATGLDEDENTNPILLEHFGITTVEAMASGCVPVVIAKGGQKEIVSSESGFLWTTREELLERTKSLIKNPKLWQKMSAAAIKRSKFFRRERFAQELAELIEK